MERGLLVPFGWTTTVLAILSFLVVSTAIWNDFDNELATWAGRAIALLVGLLLVTTQLLLLRLDRFKPLVGMTAGVAALATICTMTALGPEDSAALWQAAAIFWILSALGFFLLPVLQRSATADAPPLAGRVLAELDGVELVVARGVGTEVNLAAGERLLLWRRAG